MTGTLFGLGLLYVILAGVLWAVVVYFVSFLLIRALSRYRELVADGGAALLTGKPSALARAQTQPPGHGGDRHGPPRGEHHTC